MKRSPWTKVQWNELSERARELYFQIGMSAHSIAYRLKCSEGTVWNLINRRRPKYFKKEIP